MDNYEKGQYALSSFRIMVGWLLIWGFLDKLFGLGFQTPAGSGMIDGGSPSSFVVYAGGGVFFDFFKSLAGNFYVDLLFMAGLLGIGTVLILGIAPKVTLVLTAVFMMVMYCVHVPPLDNPIIDHRILIIVGMLAVYWLGGFEKLSLNPWWRSTVIVEKFPILG